MVFAFFVFTGLLLITICLIASDPGPATIASSAIWEIFVGNCRLHCRRNRDEVKGPLVQNLSITPAAGHTSHTFKQAIGRIDLRDSKQTPEAAGPPQVPSTETNTPAPTSTPVPTTEEPATNTGTQACKFCVCETCACDLIEKLVSNTKPAEHAYHDFKEAVLGSYIFLTLQNMYIRLANSYPATIKYLEEDKIDSEENFYFVRSQDGLSSKASAVRKSVDINKRSSNKAVPWPINISPTSSTSKIPYPDTHSSPSSSKNPSSANLPSKKPCLHHEKASETPTDLALSIREAPDSSQQESSGNPAPRQPQSLASLEKEIEEFISQGPPENPPLYTCPSCKSKGLVCVRGCPKENSQKNKDKDDLHE